MSFLVCNNVARFAQSPPSLDSYLNSTAPIKEREKRFHLVASAVTGPATGFVMSEFKSHVEIESSSEKSFGVVFSFVFLLLGLYPVISGGSVRVWALAISALLVLVAFIFPRILVAPNRLWFKFGILLGNFIAPIVMTLVYFLAVFPVGLFMKILGKDLLRQKQRENQNSYWIKREENMGSMRDQF